MILFSTALKSPAAFHEQRRSLERARVRPFFSSGLQSAFAEPIALLVCSFPSGVPWGQPSPQFQTGGAAVFYPVPTPATLRHDLQCDRNFSFPAFKGI